jgi:hypothetical protein
MQSRYLALGLILLLVGGAYGLSEISMTCSPTSIGSVPTGYPACSNVYSQAFIGGIVFVAGIIVLAVGGSRRASRASRQPNLAAMTPARVAYFAGQRN